jgi:flagellar hook-basal body complex protein FliE
MSTIMPLDAVSLFNRAMGVQSTTTLQEPGQSAVPARGRQVELLRTDPRHMMPGGVMASLEPAPAPTFDEAMLQALNGVNDLQLESSDAIETMMTNPDAIDPHDVTIAMAKANMSLNITRTVLDRVVRAWRDLINTR